MPMPRLTRSPFFNSLATRRAMMVCATMISPYDDQESNDRRRRHDVIERDDADRNDVVRRDDDGVGGHRHDGIEVARGQGVGEVAEIVGEKGMHQRELRPERSLEQERL